MARQSEVSYWTRGGGGFYTTIQGKQECLAKGANDKAENGPVYRAAMAKFAGLIGQTKTERDNGETRVADLFARYQATLSLEKDNPDHDREKDFVRHTALFVERHGNKRVVDVLKANVLDVLQEATDLNSNSKHIRGRHICRPFAWAKERDEIKVNPVAGIKLPKRSKGRALVKESFMSDELCRLLIDNTHSEEHKLFLEILHCTGCRPIELRKAEAKHYHNGIITYRAEVKPGEYRHKNAKKSGKSRTIYIPEHLQARVEVLVKAHPTGAIFRTARGKEWKRTLIASAWKHVLASAPVQAYLTANGLDASKVVPYCFRHTFISAALKNKVNIVFLAEAVGNSVKQIMDTYFHADENTIKNEILSFVRGSLAR